MLDSLLSSIGENLKTFSILAPILAFLGGILTSISPCSLASVPLVVGYMTGTNENNTKRAFKISLFFSLGMAITYTALGVAAALLSKIFSQSGKWWDIFLGLLMVLMALQTWEIINLVPSRILSNKGGRTGYIGALIVGMMAGLFASPCSTPILISLLAIVASTGNLFWGIFLFLLYSIGNSILIVVAGTSTGFVGNVMSNKSYGKISNIVRIIFGLLMLLVGLYFLYTGF